MDITEFKGWLTLLVTKKQFLIKGCGEFVREKRLHFPFTGIDIAVDNAEIYLQKGEKSQIIIEGDKNILRLVKGRVKHGVLKIYTANGLNLNPSNKIRIFIATDYFDQLLNSAGSDILGAEIFSNPMLTVMNTGTGQITLSVCTELLDVRNSGSGKMVLRGYTDKMRCTSSGTGQIEARNLKAQKIFINVSGSGNSRFHCVKKIAGFISGSGDIYYNGSPKHILMNTAGSGSLIKNSFC
ncbi:head GIN domain-containing protein [Mucilaginibacter sp. E4BP6]|uniref:head GIN domain-containing protein n=1 Tax=Mucilaginibacter sp. E4BP6 TaxID=2723089 RepID=UPI0015C76516|nr:head GIN domain-containing protein [Mucilaginibacter sp. E4BP6]NYE68290.1 hypothetical protein [Mucilaginibacter sp. E4BP6]